MEELQIAFVGSPPPSGEEICASDINFDRTLPGLHQYLGTDFVDVGGRTFLEPGSETHMYAFYRKDVVLVPGHSLPLIPYDPLESDLLQKINKEKKSLIFLPGYQDHASLEDFVGCIGTTADLVAICIPDSSENAPIRAMFIGRQRIRITKATRDSSYPLVCYGKILPEASFDREMASHPLGWGLIPRSWSRFGRDPLPTRLNTHSCNESAKISTSVVSAKSSNTRSSLSSPPSHSLPINLCIPPAGNAFSIFDSRLSTWRNTGPFCSGNTNASSNSACARLDHFVDDSSDQVNFSKKSKCDIDKCEHDDDMKLNCPSNGKQCIKSESKPTRSSSPSEDIELIMDRAVDRIGRPFRYRIKQLCDPRLLARRDVLAAVAQAYASIPYWVYRQYDLNYLVAAIQAELYNWNDTWQVDKWNPELAVPFSYWLIQNLPMSGSLKSHILGIDHVVQRLRALLEVIRRSSACVCASCGANITSSQYIVCLAQEGSSQTYVNPSGVLHDIVTVSQITPNSINLIGEATAEYSWFPGYSWTIANCSSCYQHMGWLFTALNDHLRPRKFWGIRRQTVVPGLISASDWRPCI
ncbi:Protein cereblon [Schistosoma japonicum]|uniref:CULT domain-containing protein n=2 Tax=Schistosoma japonicum TaxID=6182 RepID=C1L658_SCHJA|nr:Protein cereblon [Schistosoma japonicum]KAH8852838.1 Protein cereblon [Schistosoma japonicum]CAX70186.1 hypothetical protein [Schistosoma japonicum]